MEVENPFVAESFRFEMNKAKHIRKWLDKMEGKDPRENVLSGYVYVCILTPMHEKPGDPHTPIKYWYDGLAQTVELAENYILVPRAIGDGTFYYFKPDPNAEEF